jgi:TetR/AcrR family transcriptional regulator
MSWERARTPEQIHERREAILAAAASCFRELGFEDTTLSEIARRTGIAKASVYRYFATREEIWLTLFAADAAAWADDLCAAWAPLAGSGAADDVAAAFAATWARHPRYASLAAVFDSVIEKNVTVEVLRPFKLAQLAGSLRVIAALRAALPTLSADDAGAFMLFSHCFTNGLQPMLSPPEALQQIHREPPYDGLIGDLSPSVRAHASVVLRGLLAAPRRA